MKSTVIAIGSTLLLVVACSSKQPDMIVTASDPLKAPASAPSSASAAPAVEASVLPPGHPNIDLASNQQTPSPSPAAPAGVLTGKVVETMNAGGYTYLKVQTAQGPVWAAVQQMKTKVGDTVTINAQMTMQNFESNSLHRKFDSIVFGTVGGPAKAPVQQASMMSGANAGSPAAHMAANAKNIGDVKVAKAEGPNAKTIAELWAGKSALKGKPVVVRGKVVKSLSGIMGKNWIHLRDGSGSRADGTDDITVTTDGTASVGDVVVVTGVLNADKDFGAGYLYPVIIEDAKVAK